MKPARSMAPFPLAAIVLTAAVVIPDLDAAAQQQEGIAIVGVSVVDVRAGTVLADRTVRIEGDRIAEIGPAGEVEIPDGHRRIDGSGRYLIPGLFDAHVHYIDPSTFGPLLVANGVTFVRDMGGPTDGVIDTRDRLERGDLLGPEMIVTGAIIDGDPPFWPFSIACGTEADARKAVRDLAGRGVDQIKVYTGLDEAPYRAALEEAAAAGLPAVGHVPWTVTLEDALGGGQASTEHLDGWGREIRRMAGKEAHPAGPVDREALWGGWDLYPEVPEEELDSLIARVKRSGMVICPTLVVIDRLGRLEEEEVREDPRLEYVPAWLREMWEQRSIGELEGVRETQRWRLALLQKLHEAGVPLAVGTDLANAYLVPGFSVHEEMTLFAEAGVPPAAILRYATLGPARLCGVEDRHGSVEVGKTASLVLLREDPLEDIEAVAEIEMVFLRGRPFSREDLDDLLAGARARARRGAGEAEGDAEEAVDLTLPGEVIRRGRYAIRFGEYDAGWEEFVIARSDDGYRIKAHQRPKGPGQLPSVTTYHVAEDFTFRSADWRQIAPTRLTGRYAVENGKIVVRGKRGDEEIPPQSFERDGRILIDGPAWSLQFAVLGRASLEIGEKREFRAIWFGGPSGRPEIVDPFTLERLEDGRIEIAGDEVVARRYRSRGKAAMGAFESEIWSDAEGVLLRQRVRIPFGTLDVRLEDGPGGSSPR